MNIAKPKVKAGYSLCTRQGQVITHGFICLSVSHSYTHSLGIQPDVDLNIICQLALTEQFDLSAVIHFIAYTCALVNGKWLHL